MEQMQFNGNFEQTNRCKMSVPLGLKNSQLNCSQGPQGLVEIKFKKLCAENSDCMKWENCFCTYFPFQWCWVRTRDQWTSMWNFPCFTLVCILSLHCSTRKKKTVTLTKGQMSRTHLFLQAPCTVLFVTWYNTWCLRTFSRFCNFALFCYAEFHSDQNQTGFANFQCQAFFFFFQSFPPFFCAGVILFFAVFLTNIFLWWTHSVNGSNIQKEEEAASPSALCITCYASRTKQNVIAFVHQFYCLIHTGRDARSKAN